MKGYDVEGDDDAFQTNDERVCVNVDNGEDDESTESETGSPSPNSSPNCLQLNHSPSWPQSYRESMDMFKGLSPPSNSFPKGNNTTRLTGTNPFGGYQSSDDETSLGKPFISERTLDEEVPATTLPESQQIISVNRSMPSPKQCSFTQALVNGINVLTGIGLLTTPYAVKEGGWLSTTLLLIFGVIACYTGILLKRCLESSPGLQTYPDIGQAAFGITGRLVIAVGFSSSLNHFKPMRAADINLLDVQLVDIIFCWFMSTGAAISGFLIFGDSVESQFTLNMPTKFAASKIALWTVVIITISKYALTLTPIALSLEELVPTTWLTSYGGSILIRAALVISTLVVALKFNIVLVRAHLSTFFTAAFLMALAGSLLTMLITIIFPCACYLSIRGGGLTNLQRAVCICTAMLGLLIACDGTYSAVIRIAGQN
ncbi:hypothetical protein Gohar_011189 [Gossypium harknessii]|uniref:Amino acid transporter transmembrane domain-containing protein n=1 Tax=Gossypium harknessii TaxID=34285 RepID=A0A7J9GUL5_9ROSI|nr:hypothetical protein [Gossypium harknessii]